MVRFFFLDKFSSASSYLRGSKYLVFGEGGSLCENFSKFACSNPYFLVMVVRMSHILISVQILNLDWMPTGLWWIVYC